MVEAFLLKNRRHSGNNLLHQKSFKCLSFSEKKKKLEYALASVLLEKTHIKA